MLRNASIVSILFFTTMVITAVIAPVALGHGQTPRAKAPQQLGDSATDNRFDMGTGKESLDGVSAITVGSEHTCALTTTGGVKCWGYNNYGELGDGTTVDRLTPVEVNGLASGVTAIAAGSYHTCALTDSGGVKCWGSNLYGELGDGTTTHRYTPVDVSGLTSGVAAIAAGAFYTCALTDSGGAKCWGTNSAGQLGDGTTTERMLPTDVSGLSSGMLAIDGYWGHTCALTGSGGIKCWGSNFYGQLGNGSNKNQLRPSDVSGLVSGVDAIAVGNYHTCALTASGGAKCWGNNSFGQIGNDTSNSQFTPVDVIGLTSGVDAIASADFYTCALTTSGAVKCWGSNTYGNLGDGTTISRYTPENVSNLSSGTVAIAAGWSHACALNVQGIIKCWGSNNHGQLGDGTTTDRLTPVDVGGLVSATPTSTPIATPTFTPTRTPTPTPVSVVRFEINQALGKQYDFEKGEQVDAYKFVAGKDTAIRIFLSGPIIPDIVRPQLTIRRDEAVVRNWTLTGDQPTSILNFACIDLASCENWQAGTYTFEVNVGGVTEQKTDVEFKELPPLRILAVPLKIRVGGEIKSMYDGSEYWKTAWQFLSKSYPLAHGTTGLLWTIGNEYDASNSEWNWGIALHVAFSLNVQNNRNCAPSSDSSNCYDAIIGFWPSTEFPGGTPGVTLGTTSLACAVGSECRNALQMTVAHEIGHVYGLGDEYDDFWALRKCTVNPPPPGQTYGGCGTFPDVFAWKDVRYGSSVTDGAFAFDVGNLSPVTDRLSFMGSTSSTLTLTDYWITPRAYSHLFDRFDLLARGYATAAEANFNFAAIFSGWIQSNAGTGSVHAYETVVAAIPEGTGDYVIEAVDANEQVLATQNFDVSYTVLSNPPSRIEPGAFVVVAPFPYGTTSFRIKHGGDLIDQWTISAHKPVVGIMAPTAGANIAGPTTITWESSDEDGDPLYHIIEYSPNGQDWTVLASDIETTHYTVNFDQLAGGAQARIRVTASDRINTTRATSEAFSVPDKGPEAFILSPEDGPAVLNTNDVILRGNAYDLEDGWLQSLATFTWHSDRDGYLGTGDQKAVTLSQGLHTITLSVADSSGRVGYASIQIDIGSTVYLPLVEK